MEFDAGVVVGLVFILGFIGAIAWAQIYSARQRRQRTEQEKHAPGR